MFDWILKYNEIIRSMILASIVISTIVFVTLILFIFRPKPNQKLFKYFYAFTSGFILIIGSLGLFHEAREKILDYFNGTISGINIFYVLIIGFLALLASLVILYIFKGKSLITKKEKKLKSKLNQKWLGIIMVIMHRIPAAITIGLLSNSIHQESALFIVICLHLIPETLLIYYRQFQMKYSKLKIALNIIGLNIVFFPIIVLGAVIGSGIHEYWWIESFIYIVTGIIMIYGVISELIPEYINYLNYHLHINGNNESSNKTLDHIHDIQVISRKQKKEIILISIYLITGISLAAIILIFHS